MEAGIAGTDVPAREALDLFYQLELFLLVPEAMAVLARYRSQDLEEPGELAAAAG